MRTLGVSGLCALLVLLLAGRSSGETDTFTHDGVFFSCSPSMKNTYRSFGPGLTVNTYRFVRFCKSAAYGDDGNNIDQHQITYECTWDAAAQKATEVVNDEFTYYYKGMVQNIQNYQNTLTAHCLADPWTNDIDCDDPMKGPQYPTMWAFNPPYPISAEKMEPAVRKFLKNEANNVIRNLPPEIVLPKENGKFSNGQMIFEGRSKVPDEDDTGNWKIEIELNMDQAQPGAHNIPIKDSRTLTGVCTAWIYKDLPYNGFWLVRARSMSPNHTSEWSGYTRFAIAGSKGPQFFVGPKLSLDDSVPLPGTAGDPPTVKSPTPGQVIANSVVTVQVALPQGAKSTKVDLEFTHNNKPIQAVPKWEKYAVMGGYDTAASPAGVTIKASQFPFTGKWRVRAKVAVAGAPWSASVEFDIKPLQINPNLLQRNVIKK